MSQTEQATAHGADHTDGSTYLSGQWFDDVLVPIAAARRDTGAPPYFPKWRDGASSTYFEAAGVRSMCAADFEFPGGGSAVGLVESLTTHWLREGELALAYAAPRLAAVAHALQDEAVQDDGNVDIFCYTLF